MATFRRKDAEVEATQWWKNGDHPADDTHEITPEGGGEPFLSEGKVVRYYRNPDDHPGRECEHCGVIMHLHGWIDDGANGQIVCPGDWVVTVEAEDGPSYLVVRPGEFAEIYETTDGGDDDDNDDQ